MLGWIFAVLAARALVLWSGILFPVVLIATCCFLHSRQARWRRSSLALLPCEARPVFRWQ